MNALQVLYIVATDFSKLLFSKNSSRSTILRVSNGLDPD